MRLAHPVRTLVEGEKVYEAFEAHLGPRRLEALRQLCNDPQLLTSEIGLKLSETPDFKELADLLLLTNHQGGGTEMGNSFNFLLGLRQYLSPQPHFQVEDSLLELLEHTDISKELSVDSLKLPFNRCYIEMGASRSIPQRIPNIESGLHILEGVYCEAGVHPHYGEGLYFMFTGSPLGKSGPLDDATNSIFLRLNPKGRSISEVLSESVVLSKQVASDGGLRSSPSEFEKYSLEALGLLAKVLLYISLPECRRSIRPEKSLALQNAQKKKNPSKLKKALKLARKAQDVILIQAAPEHLSPAGQKGTSLGRKVRAHWRRGHYRMHAYGPGFTLRKLLFVQPVLVAAEAASEVKPAEYRVSI
jgi:hypothetical protein